MATAETTKPKPKTALFNLDTLTPHNHILVDGTPYDLLTIDQVSLVAFHKLQQYCPRYDALMAQPGLTDEEGEELTTLLVRIAGLVLEAPPDIHARLNDSQRLSIVMAFIGLSRTPLTPTRATTTATVRPLTGAKKSQASAGSTRAPRRRRG